MSNQELPSSTLDEAIKSKNEFCMLSSGTSTQKRKIPNESFQENKRIKPNRRPGCGDEKYEETEYYFENGLRKVYPYTYTYTSYCKGRWVGQPLMTVFSTEFRSHSRIEYEKFVKSGKVTVNGEKIEPDYILKDNDLIANRVHRHETAVLAAPLKIIHHSDDLVVVDKPPSIPVHPCGRYRNNTIAFILAKEHGLKDLHVLHRLDRLTSGVLLFGKKAKITREIEEAIRERKVSKEYVCRVDGNFPDEPVTCEKPIELLSFKAGFCIASPEGKPSKTVFQKLSYNGKTSVVSCKPKTGRMHQIRVHLQYLGYPIVNDPIYNDSVFGPKKGKDGEYGKSKEKLVEDYLNTHNVENWITPVKLINGQDRNGPLEESAYEATVMLPSLRHYTDSTEFKELEDKYKFDAKKIVLDPDCLDCTLSYKDPPQADLIMYLHALRYKGGDWEFVTAIPAWARETWQED